METNSTGTPTATSEPAADPGRAAFEAKLAEIREAGAVTETTFAEKLQEAGVDVEVRDKDPEPDVEEVPAQEAPEEPAEAPAAPDDPDAAEDAQDALLDALEGQKPGEKRQAKMERRNAIEERLVALGVDEAIANSIAHRTKLAKAEEFLASQEATGENSRAGLDEQAQQNTPASSATSAGALAPEVREGLEDALGEVPAKAIAEELSRLRAELAEVRGQAQVSVEATRAQHRAAAKATLDTAVGELSERFPQLVRDGVLDPSVGQTAAALLHTPLVGGDLNKALEQAARLRFPEVEAESRQSTQPAQTRDTLAPGNRRQSSAKPLTEREAFLLRAQIAGKYQNDPVKAKAELDKLNRRMR